MKKLRRIARAGSSLFLVALAVVGPRPARAAEYFIDSDDYKDGEEVVGKFLGDAEYSVMVEEIERNGESFDWGWVLTPGYGQQAATQPEPRKLGRLFKRGRTGSGTVQEPKALGFDLSTYRTVYVAPVGLFHGLRDDALMVSTRRDFQLAMESLGLQNVDAPEAADLELGAAIVDVKAEGTYAYVARIDPFIEIEFRLTDRKAGRPLVLLRNQAHSNTPAEAARRYATLLVRFLQ